MQHRLRLYTGDDNTSTTTMEAKQVTIRLSDMTSALAEAFYRNRTWLADFEDDEVKISEDLYEVITAFSHYRPSA